MRANFVARSKQAGDTIVEVMVVVAILGLAFSIAYATATHSLNKTRNAEEHAEALQYINSQIELIRNDATDPQLQTTGAIYCMDPTTDKAVFSTDPSFLNICNNIGLEKIYNIAVTYVKTIGQSSAPQDDVYQVKITWPGLSDLGQQQEDLYYKVHSL